MKSDKTNNLFNSVNSTQNQKDTHAIYYNPIFNSTQQNHNRQLKIAASRQLLLLLLSALSTPLISLILLRSL